MSNKLLSYFTLLSFSVSLAQLILAIIIESPLRGTGERWDVSWGGGLMVYWTLGVHLTEKKSVPGGAHLGKKNMLHTSVEHIHKSQIIVKGAKNKQQVHGRFPPGLTLTSPTDE